MDGLTLPIYMLLIEHSAKVLHNNKYYYNQLFLVLNDAHPRKKLHKQNVPNELDYNTNNNELLSICV